MPPHLRLVGGDEDEPPGPTAWSEFARLHLQHLDRIARAIEGLSGGSRERFGVDSPSARCSDDDMLRLAPVDGSAGIADLVESWTDHLQRADNARGYIHSERKQVLRAAELANWQRPEHITVESLERWMDKLIASGVTAKTRKNYRDSLDRFCEWLKGKNLLTNNKGDAYNPVKALPSPIVKKAPARLVPTDDEVRRLILAARADWRAKDLWLAFLTMATTGLRVSECAALRPDMVTADPWIDLPPEMTKTKRAERVYLTPETHRYLRIHAGQRKGPRLFETGMKRRQVKTYAQKASPPVPVRKGPLTLSYHSFRHYMAERLGRLGASTDDARWAMRHMPQTLTGSVYGYVDHARHTSVADFFHARIPLLLPDLGASKPAENEKNGPKDSSGACNRADGVYAEVAEADSLMHTTPYNTTPNGLLAANLPSASATDRVCDGERATGGRVLQGVAQLGRAPGLGPGGRQFKSDRPDSAIEVSGPASAVPAGSGPEVQILSP